MKFNLFRRMAGPRFFCDNARQSLCLLCPSPAPARASPRWPDRTGQSRGRGLSSEKLAAEPLEHQLATRARTLRPGIGLGSLGVVFILPS